MTDTPKSEASIEGSTIQYVERSEYCRVLTSWNAEKIRADHLQARFDSLSAKHERVLQALEVANTALEKISYWGVAPTSTAIAVVSEKALDQIEELKK